MNDGMTASRLITLRVALHKLNGVRSLAPQDQQRAVVETLTELVITLGEVGLFDEMLQDVEEEIRKITG